MNYRQIKQSEAAKCKNATAVNNTDDWLKVKSVHLTLSTTARKDTPAGPLTQYEASHPAKIGEPF